MIESPTRTKNGVHPVPAALIETYETAGDGPTVAVKDCIDIAGRRTACGSRAFAEAPPASVHAEVVQALAGGGYRIAGKASMHELAYGMTGVNAWSGPVGNPLFPGVMPGGSSSGSAAAVAGGLVDIALGTDTGGSVRMPAACCGVVGFKPSFGRLSRVGVSPRETSLDSVGLFARAVAPVAQAMHVLDSEFDPALAAGSPAIGVLQIAAEPEISAAIAALFARSGLDVRKCTLAGIEEAFEAGVVQMAAEANVAYGHLVATGLLGADVEQRLRAAPALATPEKLAWVEKVRREFVANLDVLFECFDVLALPTLPAFPPRLDALGDPAAILRLSAYVRPFNLSGHPAISLPVATVSGRPAGLQLVAPIGADAHLCAIARDLFDAAASIQKKEVTE
jgi:amidase